MPYRILTEVMQGLGVRAWLGFTLALATPACSSEPCAYDETVSVAPETTPFSDGRTVVSVCDRCPVLPELAGVPVSGPATGCEVLFRDEGAHASVLCLYGPGALATSSIANDAIKDAPNEFDFCENRCPAADALHGCRLTAEASGVQEMRCLYGQTCG